MDAIREVAAKHWLVVRLVFMKMLLPLPRTIALRKLILAAGIPTFAGGGQ